MIRTTHALAALALIALTGCDPVQMADKVGRRTAETVVRPIVSDYLPGAAGETATRCIIENASADEIKALMQDVGVGAGPRTVDNVLAVAAKPETVSCMAAAGLPKLGG